ncbi:MAG: hypothetical protein E7644_07275 [Ruminococcaceae bacterium]|nr:hypothetical protein [Oscillospiraceae bacterium]
MLQGGKGGNGHLTRKRYRKNRNIKELNHENAVQLPLLCVSCIWVIHWGLSGCSHELFFESFDPTFLKVGGCGRRPQKTPFLFDNFFFAAHTCKEKVAKESESPCGYSHLASANSLPAFLFDTRGTKRKAIKREMPCGALPQTPQAF